MCKCNCNCNEAVEVKFAKVKPDAVTPSKDEWNAGFDMYSCFEEDYVEIGGLETRIIDSGIAMVIPNDYYFQIQERGSTGTKGMKYGAGVIDASYRGSIMIPITNTTNKVIAIVKDEDRFIDIKRKELRVATDSFNPSGSGRLSDSELIELIREDYIIYPYDKAIAQMVLLPVPRTNIEEISYDKLKTIPSERGVGKLGSSGK